MLLHDPPQPEELTNAIGLVQDHLDDALRAVPSWPRRATIVGVAGTIITHRRRRARLVYDRDARRTTSCSPATPPRTCSARWPPSRSPTASTTPACQPERADIIVGGCCVLVAVLRRCTPPSCSCPRRICSTRLPARLLVCWSRRARLPSARHPSVASRAVLRLFGRRVMLRPLVAADFPQWSEVRVRNEDWLLKWEPQRLPGQPDPTRDREAFAVRCSARERERQLGTGYGFGIFVDGAFAGEINLNSRAAGPVPERLRRLLDRRGEGRQRLHARERRRDAAVRLRRPAAAPAAGRDHPPQSQQPAGGREARASARRASRCATSRSTACGRTTSATPSPPRSGTQRRDELHQRLAA